MVYTVRITTVVRSLQFEQTEGSCRPCLEHEDEDTASSATVPMD